MCRCFSICFNHTCRSFQFEPISQFDSIIQTQVQLFLPVIGSGQIGLIISISQRNTVIRFIRRTCYTQIMLIRITTGKQFIQAIGIAHKHCTPIGYSRLVNSFNALSHLFQVFFSPAPPVMFRHFFIGFQPHGGIFLHTGRKSHNTIGSETHIEAIIYSWLAFTFFGSYQYNTISCFCTINGS